MRTSNGEREVGLTALGCSGGERESGGSTEGPGRPGTPATRGMDPCQRSAAHSTQPALPPAAAARTGTPSVCSRAPEEPVGA